MAPEIKEEQRVSGATPYERIRLFEPVEPKIVVEQAPVEPDENTPKSIPKNEKDQFIRKRMIIFLLRQSGSRQIESWHIF